MKSFKKFMTDAPYAASESERIKYIILRTATAFFAGTFLVGLVSLFIYEVALQSTLSEALKIVWGVSVIMFVAMWAIIATPLYRLAFAMWSVGFFLNGYILITVVGTESSVYRCLVFITVTILIMSGFLRRRYLYTIALWFYAGLLLSIFNAGLGTLGFIFPVTVLCAFSLGAIELALRIRQAEARMREQERVRALHSSRLSTLGETTAFLVHEVSSPLTILAGHLELVEKKEDIDYHTSKMKNALDRAIDFMSSVKRMVRANQPNEYEVVQLSEILKMVSDLIEPNLRRNGVRLEFDYAEDIELRCRPAEIAQVIINLVNNSAEAVEGEDLKWIRVSSKQSGRFLDIEITDPGTGIDAANANRVMDPFFTTKSTGSGIGLAVAQQVALHHDGRVDITSLKNPTSVRLRVAITPDFAKSGVQSNRHL